MTRIKLEGEAFIAVSMYLLVFYLCLPISMIYLNSFLIYVIAFLSAICFIVGLILLNKCVHLICFLIIFAFTFLYWQITWSVQLGTFSYVYYCFASLSFIFGGMVLHSSYNNARLRHLFFYITIIFFVTAITSIIGLSVYPLAARELARGSTYDTSLDFTTYKNIYRTMNIASWSQIYGMLFGIPVSIMVWKKKRNLFFLAMCVSLLAAIVASQITFAVILAFVLIVGVFVSRDNNIKTLILIWILLITILILMLYLDYFLSFIVNISENMGFDFLTTKLDDLRVLLLDGNAIGDAASRGELYQRSIMTFSKNPLFGLLTIGKASLDNVGFHSEFLDLLATLGLVGLIVLILSVGGYLRFLKKINNNTRRDLLIIFIGFILLFILNPVLNSPQIFVGAFLYPLLASKYCFMIGENKEKKRKFIITVR